MTRTEALIALNMTAHVGSVRLNKLLEYFESPKKIFAASFEKLVSIQDIGKVTAASIAGFDLELLGQEIKRALALDIEIITIDQASYPRQLKSIPDCPIALYVKGKIDEADDQALAIVGSRRASLYGLNSAQSFAAGLAQAGFSIVSGMARGIDTYAHRGALAVGGRTIAVLGSGLNQIYPPENAQLAEKISEHGAVISEFSLDVLPLRQNFPRRNRVISGLSKGVMVVEAARNSGALITVDYALEQGRDVFALPGKADSATSFGTNALIKQGAKLVTCIEDILEEYAPLTVAERKQEERLTTVQDPDLSTDEKAVYSLICEESVQIDDLIEKARLDIPKISDILFRLQSKKLIRQLAGKNFVRSH